MLHTKRLLNIKYDLLSNAYLRALNSLYSMGNMVKLFLLLLNLCVNKKWTNKDGREKYIDKSLINHFTCE